MSLNTEPPLRREASKDEAEVQPVEPEPRGPPAVEPEDAQVAEPPRAIPPVEPPLQAYPMQMQPNMRAPQMGYRPAPAKVARPEEPTRQWSFQDSPWNNNICLTISIVMFFLAIPLWVVGSIYIGAHIGHSYDYYYDRYHDTNLEIGVPCFIAGALLTIMTSVLTGLILCRRNVLKTEHRPCTCKYSCWNNKICLSVSISLLPISVLAGIADHLIVENPPLLFVGVVGAVTCWTFIGCIGLWDSPTHETSTVELKHAWKNCAWLSTALISLAFGLFLMILAILFVCGAPMANEEHGYNGAKFTYAASAGFPAIIIIVASFAALCRGCRPFEEADYKVTSPSACCYHSVPMLHMPRADIENQAREPLLADA